MSRSQQKNIEGVDVGIGPHNRIILMACEDYGQSPWQFWNPNDARAVAAELVRLADLLDASDA